MRKLLYSSQNTQSYTRSSEISLAVVVLDMHEPFVRFLPSQERERIIPPQQSVLEYCAGAGIPAILVEYGESRKTIDRILSAWSTVPIRARVVKEADSAFSNPELDRILIEWGVNYLYLMGINATCCVKQTAWSALEAYGIGTSGDVIGDSANPSSRAKTTRWFEKNSDFFDTYEDMIMHMCQQTSKH